ncbi:alpha/beta fold hydrolase [Arenibacterium sp. CAU 1754]
MSTLFSILWIILVAALVLAALLYLWTGSMARQAEKAIPQTGPKQPVNGGSIHYVEMGPENAPPVVLIHGLSGQLQHMTYAISDLLAQDFRVIAIDRPGCGYSDRDSDDLAALDEQARMIWEFLDAKGIERPVLAGHSLGGALSLAMALHDPDKAGALALLAPATQHEDEVAPIFQGLAIESPVMRRMVANTIAIPMGKFMADKVIKAAFYPEPPVSDFLIRAAAVLGMRPKAFVGASADLVMLEDGLPQQSAQYPQLKVPGGILYGDKDALLSCEVHGKPMQAFGLQYEELAGRGHMIPMTAPAECADFIRRMAALRT